MQNKDLCIGRLFSNTYNVRHHNMQTADEPLKQKGQITTQKNLMKKNPPLLKP